MKNHPLNKVFSTLCLFIFICLAQTHVAHAALDKSSFYTNFTNTHFIDQNNESFKPESFIGKVALFNFVYTKCNNICPTQTKQLAEIYNRFPKAYQDKIVFVTISLDSQYDKPDELKKYAEKMHADKPQWQFVSGGYDDIKSLQDKLFLFGNPKNPAHPKVDIEKLKTKQSEDVLKNHMTILWVVDKQGVLIQRYSASPMDVPRLETELKQISDL